MFLLMAFDKRKRTALKNNSLVFDIKCPSEYECMSVALIQYLLDILEPEFISHQHSIRRFREVKQVT